MKRRSLKRTMTLSLAGLGALIVLVFTALMLTSGIFTAPRYLDPWQQDYADQFDDPRMKLAAHGLLAASGHNTQPWRVKLDEQDPDVFYLFADNSRLTPQVDPLARQTLVSQGTFLANVEIAGEQWGYRTAIELFPDGGYDEQQLAASMAAKPVARIVIAAKPAKAQPDGGPAGADDAGKEQGGEQATATGGGALYEALFLPDTNRAAYQADPLDESQVQRLLALASSTGASLRIYQDAENREKLGRYAVAGAEVEAAVMRISAETAAVFRPNERAKNRYRSGFSVEGQGTSGLMKHVLQGLLTWIPSLNGEKAEAVRFIQSTRTAVGHTPGYGMIVTPGNTRTEQVQSGMLYGRLILELHTMGFVLQPPSQVLEEYPEMEELYHQVHSEYAAEGSTIQMFFRLGKPTKSYPLSMRRDVLDLLEP